MFGTSTKAKVLMVMHGSPDIGYERAATSFVQSWQRQYSRMEAMPCFLEHQAPLLADLLRGREASRYRCLVPLFLNEGRHVQHDIPALAAGLAGLHVSRPLTDVEAIGDVTVARLEEMPNIAGHLLLYSHGSRDDRDTVEQLAEVLRARLEWPVSVVLSSDGEQGLEQAMRKASDAGATSMTIVPHFLFDGRWRQRLEESVALLRQRHGFQSVAIAEALGEHPAMFALIEKRIRECLGEA
jgi:sirohydrochlorin ferrochelatase